MRKWLVPLFEEYIAVVENLTPDDQDTAEQWVQWMRDRWAASGKTTLVQQKGLLREIRAALKDRLPESHIALKTMNFSTEEWIQVNRATTQRVASQNSQQRVLSPGTVNALVSRATQLLQSPEWTDIAAGVAVLTGRRITEILKTATFEPKTDYSVIFRGALKRGGEEKELVFEIPTLCRASYVLSATKKLRDTVATDALSNKDVNNRFSGIVAQACDRHFADLVEPPAERENLYTHLFRKIYATIATYFYCPLQVDEAEFRAEIQGHFSGHEHLTLAERRSIASDRHYRSYVILDADGNSKKGIRLEWQGVEVLEAFQSEFNVEDEPMSPSTPEPASEPQVKKRRSTTIPIWHDSRPRWEAVLEAIAPASTSRKEDRTLLLLEWIEAQLAKDQQGKGRQEKDPFPLDRVLLEEHTQAIAQLRDELNWLKTSMGHERMGNESVNIRHLEEKIAQLRAENEQLQSERDLALAKLDQFRQLLNGDTSEGAANLEPESGPQPESKPEQTMTGLAPPPPKLAIAPHPAPPDTDLDPDVLRALDAIMQYNDTCSSHAQKWAISYPPMKELLMAVGKATQPKIKAVFDAKAAEIEAHHRKHSLGLRHNRKHSNESISDFVAFE